MGLAAALRSRVVDVVLVTFLLAVLLVTVEVLVSHTSTSPQPLRSPAANMSASPAPGSTHVPTH